MARTEETMTQSVQGTQRNILTELTWEAINEPGTYVERGSGDLYRFTKESLIPGASPSIVKESNGTSLLLKISDDPFITTFKARLICAQHNVEPNF
jgi:N6-adenosine-specific RNA methylase IME4